MSNQPQGGLFSNTGSPPVILGFLAVGLFVVALIVLFGFRRFHRGRFNTPVARPQFPRRVPGVVDIGEKPKLWDVYLHHDLPKWNDMQPLSASYEDPLGGKPPEPPAKVPPMFSRPMLVERICKLVRRPREKPELPVHAESTKTTEAYRHIQVAVAILMPSRHHHHGVSEGEDVSVYEIGLVQARIPSSSTTDL